VSRLYIVAGICSLFRRTTEVVLLEVRTYIINFRWQVNVTTLPSSENMCRLVQHKKSRSQHGYKGTANKTKARVASHGICFELLHSAHKHIAPEENCNIIYLRRISYFYYYFYTTGSIDLRS